MLLGYSMTKMMTFLKPLKNDSVSKFYYFKLNFSFLAAFLGQEKNSLIYCPYPWMRNSDVEINNFPKRLDCSKKLLAKFFKNVF